jgi:hypothetical protein
VASRAVVMYRRSMKVDTIEIDSCLDENHDLPNVVTSHPVEEGSPITDHVRPDPDTVSLRCYVSNTPLSLEQAGRAVRSGDVDYTTSAATSARLSTGEVTGRGANAYAKLLKLRNEGTLIEVVTTLRTYKKDGDGGLVIERLSIPRTRENFDGLEFNLTLKQIRIVRNRRATDRRQRSVNTRAAKKDGHKTTEEVEDNRSELAKTADGDGAINKIGGALKGILGGGG